jgi:hypothetical protein
MLGLDPEPRTMVDNRVWFGQKIALWRCKVAWDIAAKQAAEIVARCSHMTGCPAVAVESEPCLTDCPDREFRMSALVILNAARQFAPPSATKVAQQPYSAPTREYFSEIVAELAACQAELEKLRGAAVTLPPPNEPPKEQS